jgi:hypothetical protein
LPAARISGRPVPDMILFLDIDGVIATYTSWAECADRLHRPAVRNLNRLLRGRDFQIVISSTWRLQHDIHELREMLACLEGEIISVTPSHLSRGEEILTWLHEHQCNDEYLVIDDYIDDIVGHVPNDRLMHVEHGLDEEGFTESNLYAAIAAFERFS